ncbi:hypothetical protein BC936DRAFT_141084 [Jimgerdemannia flammicorona]|uniref:Uncharacterized protein n=1 Tax=Jimgerdemannia flammicorona TaxID=994334 RepID=A0A433A2X9_9FUNG|nr:hypothetical protein BC936DRAFT_141084 [Jimgerdemannia flammicorona]
MPHNENAPIIKKLEDDDGTDHKSKDKPPAWTIEGMVVRSLEPSVTPAETKEYKRYINQFRNVSTLSTADSITSHPEYEHYSGYVSRNATHIRVQAIDEEWYATYVEMPKRAAISIQATRDGVYGPNSGAARGRYDAYGSYLRTGKFAPPPSTSTGSTGGGGMASDRPRRV